jgi:hypothetical protein
VNGLDVDALLVLLELIAEEFPQAKAISLALTEVDRLHQPDREAEKGITVFCGSCGTAWPCPTARVLGR